MISCWLTAHLQFCLQHICHCSFPRDLYSSLKLWHMCINNPVTFLVNNWLNLWKQQVSYQTPTILPVYASWAVGLSEDRQQGKRHLAYLTHAVFTKLKHNRFISQVKTLDKTLMGFFIISQWLLMTDFKNKQINILKVMHVLNYLAKLGSILNEDWTETTNGWNLSPLSKCKL